MLKLTCSSVGVGSSYCLHSNKNTTIFQFHHFFFFLHGFCFAHLLFCSFYSSLAFSASHQNHRIRCVFFIKWKKKEKHVLTIFFPFHAHRLPVISLSIIIYAFEWRTYHVSSASAIQMWQTVKN